MKVGKWGGICLLLSVLVAGIVLLATPARVQPEAVQRQSAVSAAMRPAGYQGQSATEGLFLETIVNPPVSPITVDLSKISVRQYYESNEFDRWRRGEIDLEQSEGLLSDAESQKLQEIASRIPPDPDVQIIRPGAYPTLVRGVDSLNIDDCCGGGQLTPPDPDIAVGDDHVVAVVNAALMVHEQSDGAVVAGPTTLSSFFGALGGGCANFPFDPNALYDEEARRYVVAADGNGDFYCVAVSATADPTGQWHLYAFPTDVGGAFFDYPHIGVGSDALYMGANMFGVGNGRVWAFDKWAMYNGQPASSVSQATGTDDTPQPLKAHGFEQGTWPAAGSHYFLAHRSGAETYVLYRWSDPFGTNAMVVAGVFDLSAHHGVTVGYPLNSLQLGGQSIKAGDNRALDFEWRNGSGWMTSAVSCNPGSGSVNCIQWAEINLTSHVVAQAGVFASEGAFRYFPDLALNHCGDAVVGYTRSSAEEYPSVYVAGRSGSDPAGAMGGEILVRAGEQRYTGYDGSPFRWGDYTSMSVAPDGLTFWYLGQYSEQDVANQTANWGTYAASLTYPGCATEPDFQITAAPAEQAICLPGSASFTVDITPLQGFGNPVALSASGLPIGVDSSFSVNPVLPAGSSHLLLSAGNSALAGSYAVDIRGVTLTRTQTTTVSLALFDATPGAGAPVEPADGASSVSPTPLFSWLPAAGATAYTLQIATDANFASVVYSATIPGSTHTAEMALSPLTTYYWTVTPQNACGAGPATIARTFTTADTPPILLVDDDDNSPDVLAAYVAALDGLGLDYDVFDAGFGEADPTVATLLPYEMVIWFTGDAFGGIAGPGSAGEAALGTYLSSGKCLLMSSQDYLYDRGLTAFIQTYLGVGSYLNDVGQTTVSGAGTVYGDIEAENLTYPYQNYSDRVVPSATAQLAFSGNSGNAGVSKEAGYKTTFLGFPLEAMALATRQSVLAAAYGWCNEGPEPIYQLDVSWTLGDGSGGVDLLSFFEDGSFQDGAGHAGNWYAQGAPERITFYYTDGSHCSAFSRGVLVGANSYEGYRLCTDSSLRRGVWQGSMPFEPQVTVAPATRR